MKKKLFSILLSLAMVISMMPATAMTAFAADSHEHDGVSFEKWDSDNSLPQGNQAVYLTKDITLTQTWEVKNSDIELCLNGHVIKSNGFDGILCHISSDSSLKIYDCIETEHKFSISDNGLWELNGDGSESLFGGCITGGKTKDNPNCNGGAFWVDGKLKIYGGNIVGNTANDGGAIYNNGQFTIYDGNIIGNISRNTGGAITSTKGIIDMNGGCISGNACVENNLFGGGVYLQNTFMTIYSGVISRNKSTNGGGIYAKDSTIYMNNGEISNNTVTNNGGGIYVQSGIFKMSDGIISYNSSQGDNSPGTGGGGVYCDGTFNLENGTIKYNSANNCYGGGVLYGDTFNMYGGEICYNKARFGGGISSKSYSKKLNIFSGKIRYNEAWNNGAINVNFGDVNISGDAQNKIYITHNVSSFVGAFDFLLTDASMTLSISGSVIIKNNRSTSDCKYENNLVFFYNNGRSEYFRPIKIGKVVNSEIYYSLCDDGKGVNSGYATIITSGYAANNPGKGFDEYFHYEGYPTHYAALSTNGEIETKAVPEDNYGIATPNAKNGSVTADMQYASENAEVTITITPDYGYELSAGSVKVNDTTGANIEISAEAANTYTFKMPKKGVIITAEFKAKQSMVILNAQGGKGGTPSVIATYDSPMPNATMPTRDGYTFNGYFNSETGGIKYYNADGTSAKNWDKIDAAGTLYAQWTSTTPEPTPSTDPEPVINKQPIELLRVKTYGKRAVKLTWNAQDNATKYVVYGARCGKSYKKLKTTTGKSYTVKKINGKKLKAHKTYKFYVVAYTPDGKVKSRTLHFITGNTAGKYANVKSIKAKYDDMLLSVGVTQKIGATYKMYKGKKHIKKSHGTGLVYKSNCPSVATVSKTGVVTAKSKGTATIYIQDIGGKYCKTNVTVE